MLINPYVYAAAGPSFANVMLLCHFDGTNGSTTIIDSTGRHTITSTVQLTMAQQKFGTASLNSGFGGSCSTVDSADWHFGAGQFTVEAWIRPTATISGFVSVVAQFGGVTELGWFFGFNGNTLNFFYSTTGADFPLITGPYTPTTNAWVHVAADRDASNVLRVYANGVVIASGSAAATFYNSTRHLHIGNDENLTRQFVGQIDDLRITKGAAWYAGAFTPPTAAFPDT